MSTAEAPRTARARLAEETKARLIDAAIDRFAADGLGASFDVVAADAGVTKGALYHHFGSKDGLVEAVYAEAIRRHAAKVVGALGDGTGRERLLALVDASAELYLSGSAFYGLLVRLHFESATARPGLAPIARRVQDRQRDFMTGLVREGRADGSIRPGPDPEAVGLLVNAALQGLLLEQHASPERRHHFISTFRNLLEETL